MYNRKNNMCNLKRLRNVIKLRRKPDNEGRVKQCVGPSSDSTFPIGGDVLHYLAIKIFAYDMFTVCISL